jgi:endonuclease III-like uncharacterized protein
MAISEHQINDRELLGRIDGLGKTTIDALLDHFGHGYFVAQSACRYWGELAKVEGISRDRAKELFFDMQDAGVFDELNSDQALVEALDQGHNGNKHGGGY